MACRVCSAVTSSVVVPSALGSGEDVEPEVAAAFGPFVVLLGQDGADEADDRVPVGEEADHVGAAADLLVESFVGVVRSDLPVGLGRHQRVHERLQQLAQQIRRRLGELFLQQARRVDTSSDGHRRVPFLESVVRDHSKDHAVATPGDTLTALPIHHVAGRH